MNFMELFNTLEQENQTNKNFEFLKQIVHSYITNDISFNFTNDRVDLNKYLTKEDIDEIAEEYGTPTPTSEEEKINSEVIFALECVESYTNGYLGSIEKYPCEMNKGTIVFIKGLLDHIKIMKKRGGV